MCWKPSESFWCPSKFLHRHHNRNALEVVHAVPSISATINSDVLRISSQPVPGRPPFMIDMESVLYLLYLSFKMIDVAKCFLIHWTTLWRKLRTINIQARKFTHGPYNSHLSTNDKNMKYKSD